MSYITGVSRFLKFISPFHFHVFHLDSTGCRGRVWVMPLSMFLMSALHQNNHLLLTRWWNMFYLLGTCQHTYRPHVICSVTITATKCQWVTSVKITIHTTRQSFNISFLQQEDSPCMVHVLGHSLHQIRSYLFVYHVTHNAPVLHPEYLGPHPK